MQKKRLVKIISEPQVTLLKVTFFIFLNVIQVCSKWESITGYVVCHVNLQQSKRAHRKTNV